MADTGYVAAGQGRSVTGVGTVAWSLPGNIVSNNSSNAFVTVPTGGRSNWLVADTFGFAISAGDTIVGVEVEVECRFNSTSPAMYLSQARLGKDDSTFGSDKADVAMPLDTSVAGLTTFGGPTDLWGLSLTPAEVNASTFQFRFHAYNTEAYSLTASCDVISMKVYHVTPSGTLAISRGFIIN